MTGLSDVIGRAGVSLLPQIALVIFFLVFVGIVAYVVLKRRSAWEHARHLPLDDELPKVDAEERRL